MSVAAPAVITPFGPSGKTVYDRTYSRTKPDGSKETWPETVDRVARGNMALVYGSDLYDYTSDQMNELTRLKFYMNEMALLPAGRHLWATGVPGRQYLSNCHAAGWGDKLSRHFEFSFLRLMEGGGVGSNYSSKYTGKYGAPRRQLKIHLLSTKDHQDIEELRPYLSDRDLPAGQYVFPVHDSREGWAYALVDMIDAFMSYGWSYGEELFYDVSRVRPSGSELKTFGGTASGPAPFARMMHEVARVLNSAQDKGNFTPLDAMEIDHAIAECVVSGGNRRSARMSIVHWADPHIFEFLKCKTDTGKHWTTNISVEIDDRFLLCLGTPYANNDPDFSQAKSVHQAVCAAALENGEPGYWNSSLSSIGEVDEVITTNPCGEVPLEPWGVCNLGHVNMDWFWDKTQEELTEAHQLMTRFLMRATFADFNDGDQLATVNRNRRIGVGHLGVQGFWAKNGYKYTEIPFVAPEQLKYLYSVVRQEAREYAFKLRIPEPVKVTTVAPTGSVAKLPGVSEGIHPIYARHFERRIRFSKRDEAQFATVMQAMADGFTVEDDVYDQSGMTAVVVYPTQDILISQVLAAGFDDCVVQSADEIELEDMLAVQAAYQKYWADNAVSYTCNVPEGKYDAETLAEILASYLPVLKGTTVMVDASRPQAPYTRISQAQFERAVATRIEDSTDESCASGACPIR